jgi:hypothetical protein
VYYGFHPEPVDVPIATLGTNLTVIAGLFVVFIVIGTALFVRAEKNR